MVQLRRRYDEAHVYKRYSTLGRLGRSVVFIVFLRVSESLGGGGGRHHTGKAADATRATGGRLGEGLLGGFGRMRGLLQESDGILGRASVDARS